LSNIDRNTFAKQAGTMGELIKKEVARGIIAGATEKEIADGILRGAGGALRIDQVETLVNTGLNQFERNVKVEMAEFDEPNAKYVYIGIIDSKTRDICLLMASAGELTRDEIDSRFPNTFSNSGGHNCRHHWRKETSRSKELMKPKQAKSFISKKKTFKPVTVEGVQVG